MSTLRIIASPLDSEKNYKLGTKKVQRSAMLIIFSLNLSEIVKKGEIVNVS